jgi:hypothetical protein
MAAVAIDHPDTGFQIAREFDVEMPARSAKGREGVPEIVDPAQRPEPARSRLGRRSPWLSVRC